jgi:hypothetical protein
MDASVSVKAAETAELDDDRSSALRRARRSLCPGESSSSLSSGGLRGRASSDAGRVKRWAGSLALRAMEGVVGDPRCRSLSLISSEPWARR